MSRKVFIHAYAAGNLGDDLLIRILCSRYPDVQFRMWTDIIFRNYYADIPNLKVCCPTDKWSVRIDKLASRLAGTERGMWKYLVKSSGVTVHIGGSVFVQHSEDYRAAYELDRTLRRLSRRIVVIGANFGPYTDENYLRQYRELLAGYDGVCFRDSYSGRLFGDIPNVRTAPDVAFGCRRIPQTEVRKQVLFSVIDMEHRGEIWYLPVPGGVSGSARPHCRGLYPGWL